MRWTDLPTQQVTILLIIKIFEVIEKYLDEGISLSTISQSRRMSASFDRDRRLPSAIERRLSGGKAHLG